MRDPRTSIATGAATLVAAALVAGCVDDGDARRAPDSQGAALMPAPAAADRQRKGAPPKETCYVDFLDIGTGLSVLIQCRDKDDRQLNILYDGGSNNPNLKNKNRLVYLLKEGLGFAAGSTIHHLIHSHPHFDHHSELMGAAGVLGVYDVRHVWDAAAMNDTVAYGCFMRDVMEKTRTTTLVYHPAKACPDVTKLRCDGKNLTDSFKKGSVEPFRAPSNADAMAPEVAINLGVGGISARILHADPTAHEPNYASVVMRLDLFGVRLLLTGDEEAGRRDKPEVDPKANSVEKFLLDSGFSLAADIVQVPHHGSKSSSSLKFQKAVMVKDGDTPATYAVISSGTVKYSGTELPVLEIVESWKRRLGRGRVLSTKLHDRWQPTCRKHADKIAPTPATDETMAGCNSVQFVIELKAGKGRIKSVAYWPYGPDVS